MSTILRWWTRHDPGTAPRVLSALLMVVLLGTAGITAALATEAHSAGRPVGSTEPASPPQAPSQPPARAAPQARSAAPVPSPPVWLVEPAGAFVGWAIAEYGDGGVTTLTSENGSGLSTTASMIKVWIAADYLRRTAEAGRHPTLARLAELSQIIRDSDNALTQTIFEELGAHASIERLIDICDLPHARAYANRWSNTQLSPADAALLGVCIADGRAAGPVWTDWLLHEMRLVRGTGDFGIRDALPEQQRSVVAIKNGWVVRADQRSWHVNCLAIGETWTMGVMTRYPAYLGYEHGAEMCRSLAAEHLPVPVERTGPKRPESVAQFS